MEGLYIRANDLMDVLSQTQKLEALTLTDNEYDDLHSFLALLAQGSARTPEPVCPLLNHIAIGDDRYDDEIPDGVLDMVMSRWRFAASRNAGLRVRLICCKEVWPELEDDARRGELKCCILEGLDIRYQPFPSRSSNVSTKFQNHYRGKTFLTRSFREKSLSKRDQLMLQCTSNLLFFLMG